MEENELFERYKQTGDIALRNQIVEKYLYIAAVIAKKFVGRGVEYDDLYQVAALALVKGVDRFDASKGIKFSTFITPTVTGEIKNYFRDRSRLVHLPRKVAELRADIRQAAEAFMSEEGRTPTARELAARLGVSEEEVVGCAEAGVTVSLDRPAEGGEGNFYEVLPASSENEFEKFEDRDAMRDALSTLSEAERTLIHLRFSEELSQVETAKRMNVSQMYISRLERKVLQKLKERMQRGTV